MDGHVEFEESSGITVHAGHGRRGRTTAATKVAAVANVRHLWRNWSRSQLPLSTYLVPGRGLAICVA